MGGVPGLIDRYAAYGMRTVSPSRGSATKAADSKPADKTSTERTADSLDSSAPPGTYLNIRV